MAHNDQDGNQNTAATEVVDVKPHNDKGASRLVLADGKEQDVDAVGDFLAKLQTGNIIIDPALAEKATRHEAGPPLTIGEALERGDYVALSRMLEAQSRRYENVATEHEAEVAAKARLERENARLADLSKYYDERGGYRDSHGGYYDPNAGTYTDKDGYVADNYGGVKYKDGSYKSGTGDYFDARTHTYYGADGTVRKVPESTTNEEMITAMQKNAKDNGYYDPDATKRSRAQAADRDHQTKDTPLGADGKPVVPDQERRIEEAKANQGPDLARGKVAPKRVAFVVPGTAAGSKFPTGTPASPGGATGADVTGSHFFAVDSSISSSKFSPADAPVPPTPDTPDPSVTGDAARPRTTAPKPVSPG